MALIYDLRTYLTIRAAGQGYHVEQGRASLGEQGKGSGVSS
jgi:hypothetical protein